MKFLCDVHISFKLVRLLNDSGFEAIHVNNILDKWFTKDNDICKYADENNLVVITKDSDFRDSFFLNNTPKKLIKINLGNISNQELIELFKENISAIAKLDVYNSFLVEIDKGHITFINK